MSGSTLAHREAIPPLDQIPVAQLKGVGPLSAARFAKRGIETVQDVLFHLPLRYEDRTRIVAVASLLPGSRAVVLGRVESTEVRTGRRRSLLVHLADATGSILLRFFHFNSAQRRNLIRGSRLQCYGEVRNGPSGLEIIHPEYRRVSDGDDPALEQCLTPVYPSTEGVTQQTWRNLTNQALALMDGHSGSVREFFATDLLHSLGFPSLASALAYLHRPPRDAALAQLAAGTHPAQRRLIFEELLAHQISLRCLRLEHRRAPSPVLAHAGVLRRQLVASLPFHLTSAQRRVAAEIERELASSEPMLRLVQGDVGSGKTIVAALAVLQAVEAGYQVALMAPTELLAEQHLCSFRRWLEPLGVAVTWLTGRQKARSREQALESIARGACQVVIGTHALFQAGVEFAGLGLVIVDEQHRFGVHQRLAMREKGRSKERVPHQLIMTATPIPRTLAMTAYADLDLSVIDELPPGRSPVTTVVVPDTRRDEVIERVRKACSSGRQVYWVCTLIEESEALQCQAAEDTARRLEQRLADGSVGLVHGRLTSEQRAAVMARFKTGALSVLVATTVIEVGVDVPNASLMVIENPERLGLAQLHQLRGRVGRGAIQSHCVLMYHGPLSGGSRQRLSVMRSSNDGFVIAQKDLELRGPGEVLGTRQTGELRFRVADVVRDAPLLTEVQHTADRFLREHPREAKLMVRRWLGGRADYARV